MNNLTVKIELKPKWDDLIKHPVKSIKELGDRIWDAEEAKLNVTLDGDVIDSYEIERVQGMSNTEFRKAVNDQKIKLYAQYYEASR